MCGNVLSQCKKAEALVILIKPSVTYAMFFKCPKLFSILVHVAKDSVPITKIQNCY